MKTTRLLSTVAATLLLTAGAASAQGMNQGHEQTQKAPTAQQSAPAEKIAPSMKAGSSEHQKALDQRAGNKPSETTGQAPAGEKEHGAGMKSEKNGAAETKSRSSSETMKSGGSAQKGHELDKSNQAETKSPGNQNSAQGSMGSKSSQSTTTQSQTTGQGAAGAARLSSEQRTKITTVIKQQKVEPVHANFDVRVGVRIPESVRFHPLPVEVVTIYPEWRGYDYILVGDQILVIDPRTHEIVAILEA